MKSMGLTLVAEQASIRRERAVLAILLRTFIRLQVRIQVLAVMVLEGRVNDRCENILLIDALLLCGFVVAVLDTGKGTAIPPVGVRPRVVGSVTPGLFLFMALVAGPSGVALVGFFAGAILSLRGRSKGSWLYRSVSHVTAAASG